MINRRPVAFKDGLRNTTDYVPEAITPEMLIHGFSLTSLNTIPNLQPSPDERDPDWNLSETNSIKITDEFQKIRKARDRLNNSYHSEFLSTLVNQAVDKKGRYESVKHSNLEEGDIVLLKDKYSKPTNYPMGKIIGVDVNSLGESTSAWILKGNKEKVYRHSCTIVPLIKKQFL
jgi:hypothetical protein